MAMCWMTGKNVLLCVLSSTVLLFSILNWTFGKFTNCFATQIHFQQLYFSKLNCLSLKPVNIQMNPRKRDPKSKDGSIGSTSALESCVWAPPLLIQADLDDFLKWLRSASIDSSSSSCLLVLTSLHVCMYVYGPFIDFRRSLIAVIILKLSETGKATMVPT